MEENSQLVVFLPQSLAVWGFGGLGFAAAPLVLRLVPLRTGPAPGGLLGDAPAVSEQQLG